jgi:hypothetical protein
MSRKADARILNFGIQAGPYFNRSDTGRMFYTALNA